MNIVLAALAQVLVPAHHESEPTANETRGGNKAMSGGATADRASALVTAEQQPVERHSGIILDSLDHGILAIDGENQIVFVNRIAEGIFKLGREELLGHRLDEVLKTPRNSRWLVYDPDRVATEEFQRVRRAKDGNRIILRSRTIPLRNESGEVMGAAALFTEAADDSEDLHADRDRLISLGELSASVAHEIRNPLTGIRTTVQFVQSKLEAGDSRREDLDDVVGSSTASTRSSPTFSSSPGRSRSARPTST